MNPRSVAFYTSMLLFMVAALLLPPAFLGLYDGRWQSLKAYSVSAVVTALCALLLRRLSGGSPTALHRKDAIGVVTLSWLSTGLFGALPFMIEGTIPSLDDAMFEAVSGFTTTGATVVPNVDGLGRASNLWRCLMHWIGGMGIVVLFIAVFPQLGVGAKHLFRTEVPGPITEGLRPRIKQTALSLWWIYAALTTLLTACLILAGLPLYDAVCHAFSTLGTGGFSTKGLSVGGYNNPAADWIISLFMLLAGLNFGLYYAALRGNVAELFRNYEVRFFILVNAVVIFIIFICIKARHPDALTALRFATFQTLAVTTTTGFMTEDFEAYPDLARFLLFLCMFMGGCAGSTAGGIKASRVYALSRLTVRELRAVIQPQAVIAIRLGPVALPAHVVQGILVYVTAYLLLFALTSACLVALGLDLLSAMSAVVACLSSVGPGLEQVGPTQNFGFIPALGKLLLSLCMIAGRLEIFALFAIFDPECWRR